MSSVSQSNLDCALCGGCLDRVLLKITQPDRFERHVGVEAQGYERLWVECADCGAATNVLPEKASTLLDQMRTAYYEVDFAGSAIGEKYRKVMALPADRSDNFWRVRRVADFATSWFGKAHGDGGSRPRVLDIGAGTGVFLSRFLDEASAGVRTWSSVAMEPDPVAAEHLRSLGKFDVVEGLFTGRNDLRGFDLVTLNKVLEHIANPVEVLEAVGNALRPDRGIVYVELPDKLTVEYRPANDNILGSLHYHLYHPHSLSRLLDAAGLVALRIERVFEPSGKITVFGFASLPSGVAAMAEATS